MGDLDFDELDRAVNSLIAKTPAPNSGATPAPATNMADITPVTPPAAPVVPVMPVPANMPVSPVTPPVATKSLAGQRSVGRFMDVIHPSADMRSTTTVPQVATPTPTPAPTPVLAPIQPVTPPVVTFAPEPTPAATPVAETQPETVVLSGPVQPDAFSNDAGASQTLETPFISGAKVEKRPLGAFSTEPEATAPETPAVEPQTASEPAVAPSDTVEEPSVADTSTPLPEELQSDLLKIESGNSNEPDTTVPQTSAEPTKTPAPAFENETIGPISIVQQYKEQKSKPDDKPGAIYDTSVYHKSITPDGKKKPGLMWIVWIVLLLIVGVGSGALAYFYVLPLIK